jgi:hypothetical protein
MTFETLADLTAALGVRDCELITEASLISGCHRLIEAALAFAEEAMSPIATVSGLSEPKQTRLAYNIAWLRDPK